MYTFHLTEEIARWAFEVVCKQSNDWYVAFTNPTAGPWKTIKCTDQRTGEIGEVYRFELEETRPDILLVNDTMKTILIVEAKDSIEKLTAGDQVNKTVEVVSQLTDILKRKSDCKFWGQRSTYEIITALLWGADRTIQRTEYDELFLQHRQAISEFPNVSDDIIIGVETRRKGETLTCRICGSARNGNSQRIEAIARSFGLHT